MGTSSRCAPVRANGAPTNPVGVHSGVFVGGWSKEECEKAISSAKSAGYDLIEVNVSQPEILDGAMTKAVLEAHGLQAAGSLGLTPASDISSDDESVRREGKRTVSDALKVLKALGGTYFVGVNYSAMHKYARACTPQQWQHAVASLKELTAEAADYGITYGLEVVNRYETNMLNTATKAMEMLADVGAGNVVVHLDSYHMNIEEDSMALAVDVCGDKLGYVHIGESHRGYLGTGSVDFPALFRALAAAGYGGPLTFESFSSAVVSPSLSNTLCVWRILWEDPQDLASKARAYIDVNWAARPNTVLHLPGVQPSPKPPVYSASFEVEYNFTLPYEASVQKDGLTYPVHVWKDAEAGLMRTDTYGGVNSLYIFKGSELEIYPRVDRQLCRVYDDDDEVSALEAPIMPDVAGWEYSGEEMVRGQKANVWVFEESHGVKVTRYAFHASIADGAPLRLAMRGQDLFSGSHFDEYVAEYLSFKPGAPPSSVFNPPAECAGVAAAKAPMPRPFALRMAALMPSTARLGPANPLYDAWAAQHGRTPAAPAAEARRRAAFHENLAYIEAWNAGGGRHNLSLNRFADWTQEEFKAAMLPRRRIGGLSSSRRRERRDHSAGVPYEPLAHAERLPAAVNWRGTGADGIVKDQASCGSCWAFGMSGAIHAAHFMATGQSRSFSEQQVMDCSWRDGNEACDGGDYDTAIDYLVQVGGLAREADYEYLGQDGFCRDRKHGGDADTALTRLTGYAMIPEGDEKAVMEALYSRGPLAVSLDASHDSFRFYASGVYDEPKCSETDLDHAVVLVGYGTDADSGKDYWLIKNSWSTYWGDAGYIKIARAHGCGITTSAMYALMERHDRANASAAAPSQADPASA
ncbi:hypothetical protein WJX81_002463 [Elliptochloris bilobata]|uniref:Uncharacterized protein n=1 Tax=Elliptochloris bilobata TaxID=381761 RepID=A0AAW1QUS7_9CHLO